MNKEFIPYEQALELKELGFDGACMDYKIDEKQCSYQDVNGDCVYPNCICEFNYQPLGIPLYQQAFRWFREKYDLYISITHYENGYSINDLRRFDTYEEAEFECLKKLIEIVKEK